MTDDQIPTAADYRRAAVLTLHQRRGNTAGVIAIVDETNTADRATQLLLAVCCPALKMTMTPSLSMKTKMVALVATLTG